jgi:hypothetical protein
MQFAKKLPFGENWESRKPIKRVGINLKIKV